MISENHLLLYQILFFYVVLKIMRKISILPFANEDFNKHNFCNALQVWN